MWRRKKKCLEFDYMDISMICHTLCFSENENLKKKPNDEKFFYEIKCFSMVHSCKWIECIWMENVFLCVKNKSPKKTETPKIISKKKQTKTKRNREPEKKYSGIKSERSKRRRNFLQFSSSWSVFYLLFIFLFSCVFCYARIWFRHQHQGVCAMPDHIVSLA